MKTQKLLWAALALVCALTLSCKKNDDSTNNGSEQDNKATQAMVNVSFQVTEDMYTKLDVKFIVNGLGVNDKELIINPDLLKESTSDKYKYYTIPLQATVPGTASIKTVVTAKNGVDLASVAKLDFYKGYMYQYATYNAAGKQVFISGNEMNISISPKTSTGAKLKELMDLGSVNQELSFTFDAEGKCTHKHN